MSKFLHEQNSYNNHETFEKYLNLVNDYVLDTKYSLFKTLTRIIFALTWARFTLRLPT